MESAFLGKTKEIISNELNKLLVEKYPLISIKNIEILNNIDIQLNIQEKDYADEDKLIIELSNNIKIVLIHHTQSVSNYDSLETNFIRTYIFNSNNLLNFFDSDLNEDESIISIFSFALEQCKNIKNK